MNADSPVTIITAAGDYKTVDELRIDYCVNCGWSGAPRWLSEQVDAWCCKCDSRLHNRRADMTAAGDRDRAALAPPTPATPTCAAPVAAFEWSPHAPHAFNAAGELVAVITQAWGGRRLGTYDSAAGDMHWATLDRGADADAVLQSLHDRGDLPAIPDDADLNP